VVNTVKILKFEKGGWCMSPPAPMVVPPLIDTPTTTSFIAKLLVSGVSATTVAAVAISKNGTEVVKATPAGTGTYRKPPSKIGQIRWPPSSADKEEEEEPPGLRLAPGKLLIEEQTEEETKITPKQKPEEIQRKIYERIKASQQQAAGLDEKRRKPPPAAVQAKRVSHPPTPHTPVCTGFY